MTAERGPNTLGPRHATGPEPGRNSGVTPAELAGELRITAASATTHCGGRPEVSRTFWPKNESCMTAECHRGGGQGGLSSLILYGIRSRTSTPNVVFLL